VKVFEFLLHIKRKWASLDIKQERERTGYKRGSSYIKGVYPPHFILDIKRKAGYG
jgi:hypothetical protein